MSRPHHPPLSRCGKMNIGCFSETKKTLPNGRCVESDAVVAGDHSWRIAFYPNGKLPGTMDAVSLYLLLDGDAAVEKNICVEFRFMLYEVGGGAPRFTSPAFVGDFGRRAEKALGFERFVTLEDLEESGILKHDRFTIGCEFTILSASIGPAVKWPPSALLDHGVAAPPPEPSVELPSDSSDLHADLGRLLETKEGADVKFEVRGKVFAAHKLVLAARSPVFKAEFFGTRKEETTISSYIRISDMDPKTFEALLHYMYTDSLPEVEGDAILDLDLLMAADRYNLKGLKSITEDELCNYINVSRVFKMLAVAEGYQCWKLKKMCLEFIGSRRNMNAIMATQDVDHLARSCPSVVKDVMAKILEARMATPWNDLISSMDHDSFNFSFLIDVFVITFWAVLYVVL